MFLFGFIVGLLFGLLCCKMRNLLNAMDEKTQAFTDDVSDTIRFYKWKRECRKNDI